MRIGMVSPVLGDAYGQERVMRESSDLLRAAGHQVFFVTDRVAGSLPSNDGFLEIPGLSQVTHLTSKAKAWKIFQQALDGMAQMNLDLVHLIDQFDHRFLRILCETYPTVLTAHTVAPTCPASHRMTVTGSCEQKSGYACLWHNRTAHCLDGFKNDLHRLNAIYAYQLKRTALSSLKRIIANSHFIKEQLLSDGWDSRKVELVHNPVVVHESEAQETIPENLLVCASRLVPLKGIDYLLQALARIKNQPWTLWVCGEGSERSRLESLTSELQLGARVQFLGRTSLLRTHAIIKNSLFVLQPNLGPESFGLTVAESGALGKAVVAYDVPGVNEIIVHGKTGYLVPRADITALSRGIEMLLLDSHLRDSLGAAAKERVLANYSAQKHLADTLTVYSNAIESSRTSTRQRPFPLRGETNQTT